MEREMEFTLWIAEALGLIALGATVTYLIGMAVPEPVFERARQHPGRRTRHSPCGDRRRWRSSRDGTYLPHQRRYRRQFNTFGSGARTQWRHAFRRVHGLAVVITGGHGLKIA
jgi:hypothetical protein